MPPELAVEIAVQDPAGARDALAAGADRLELCQALGVGGLTPSLGVLEAVLVAVDRILTSGGATHSVDGIATLTELVAESGPVEIMAGGGVRVVDIPALVAVGVDAVHLSARAVVGVEHPSGPGGGSSGHDVTDAALVAAAVRAATLNP